MFNMYLKIVQRLYKNVQLVLRKLTSIEEQNHELQNKENWYKKHTEGKNTHENKEKLIELIFSGT